MSVLNKWYLVIEIPQIFRKLMTKRKNPRQPGEHCLRLGPRVFIIARHRKYSQLLQSIWRRGGHGTTKVSRRVFECFRLAPRIKPGSYFEGYDYKEHRF